MSKFTKGSNLKFVQFYGQEHSLWNTASPLYKNKVMKERSLENIRTKMLSMGVVMSEKDVKTKIKNLRATFAQELSKIQKKSKKCGDEILIYKPKLSWFEEMHSFMKDVQLKRKPAENQEDPLSNHKEQNKSNSAEETDTITEQPSNSDFYTSSSILLTKLAEKTPAASTPKLAEKTPAASTPKLAEKTVARTPKFVMKTPAPKNKEVNRVVSLIKEIRTIKNDLVKREDEHDIFGMFVSSQLRALSTTQAIIARDEINSILSSYRRAELNFIKQEYQEISPSVSSDVSYDNLSFPIL